ncbi:MAG: 30S ribosomal protein S6 [Proteobacteria bacterium]|nr:30S ribosomal protein S6 [Pseudomonadota bacterium]MBU1740115.1 30S ribosomal protein S6 [Pseudomonadota bacterium]
MRRYETVFIVHPDLNEEETKAAVDRYRQILEQQQALVVKVDVWGRRSLAYLIRKQSKGVYVLFEYGADPEAVFELERNFKIDEQILRFLTVLVSDKFDPQPAVEEAPAAQDEPAQSPSEPAGSGTEAPVEEKSEEAADTPAQAEPDQMAPEAPEPREKS